MPPQQREKQQQVPPPPPTARQLPLVPPQSVEVHRGAAPGAAAAGANGRPSVTPVLQDLSGRSARGIPQRVPTRYPEQQQQQQQQLEQQQQREQRQLEQQRELEQRQQRRVDFLQEREERLEWEARREGLEGTGEKKEKQQEERRPERPAITVPIPVELLPRQPPPRLSPASPLPGEAVAVVPAQAAAGAVSDPPVIFSGVPDEGGVRQGLASAGGALLHRPRPTLAVPAARANVARMRGDAAAATPAEMATDDWRGGSTAPRRSITAPPGSSQVLPSAAPVALPATRPLMAGSVMGARPVSTDHEVDAGITTRSAFALRAAAVEVEEALGSARRLTSHADLVRAGRGDSSGSCSGGSGGASDLPAASGGTSGPARGRVVSGGVNDALGAGDRRERQGSSDSEVETSSGDDWTNGDGAAGGGSLSLVSAVAGDIVRAQKEVAIRQRREQEATARSRELRRFQDVEALLPASEEVVADAVRAAARTVANEEAHAATAAAEGAGLPIGRHDVGDGGRSRSASDSDSTTSGVDGGIPPPTPSLRGRSSEREGAGPDSDVDGNFGNDDGKRNGNHPDLWDSLLQSGPTVSPGRCRRLHSSSRTRAGAAAAAIASTAATATALGDVPLEGKAAENSERVKRESESDGMQGVGSRRDVGGRSLHGRSWEGLGGRQPHRGVERERCDGDGSGGGSGTSDGSSSGGDSSAGDDGGGWREAEPPSETAQQHHQHQHLQGGSHGSGVGDGSGGGGGSGHRGRDAGERRRNGRLAPADLQAQLLNELRLHDDLHEAELQADGLMAAQRVEEARQDARVAGMVMFRRERVSGMNTFFLGGEGCFG